MTAQGKRHGGDEQCRDSQELGSGCAAKKTLQEMVPLPVWPLRPQRVQGSQVLRQRIQSGKADTQAQDSFRCLPLASED